MGETTGITWCHATLNFWIGCTKIGPACDHCYAETWGNRFGVKWGVGEPRRPTKHNRSKALALERLAVASGQPFYCFSNSLSDIMDKEVPIEWLAAAFDDMRAAPHVTFLLLTKRPGLFVKRFREATAMDQQHDPLSEYWPPNAAIGCTVVTQAEASRDIPKLLAAKAALKPAFTFLSMEPLVEPVDLHGWLGSAGEMRTTIDWVITGGESGAHARPSHPDWFRSIRDECAAAEVPYHHKQNGEWAPCLSNDGEWPMDATGHVRLGPGGGLTPDGWPMQKVGTKHSGRLLDGVTHDAMPVAR